MNDDTPEQRLTAVRARIGDACRLAERSVDDVALLAVSKTFDTGAIRALAELGQRAFGENYLQEALPKIESLPELEWHFIGPIQSNKTRPIAEHFSWVHSVERQKIAQRLSDQRPEHLPPLNVCVQVNVSGEESKSGCAPDEVQALASAIEAMPRLALRGLMAIPEPTEDGSLQRRRFGELRKLREALLPKLTDPERFDCLSIGMSADLEAAIAEGSTMVRIGTALFGARPAAGGPAA